MKTIVKDICDLMEKIAPHNLAEDWDNVGLMLGNPYHHVNKVLLTLDLTPDIVEEAIAMKAELVVTHHPFFFTKIKTLVNNSKKNDMVYNLIKNDIAVFSAHTNLDAAVDGVNDVLTKLLGLHETEVLTARTEALYKLAVFIPTIAVKDVTRAMHEAGAGQVGNYSDCAYFMAGEGQFKPLVGSKPFVGKHGELFRTKETKVEVIVTQRRLNKVLQALFTTHPYEEPVYDIIKLENKLWSKEGIGRVGNKAEVCNLTEFAGMVKNTLGLEHVAYVDAGHKVKRVAVCGGSGAEFIMQAVAKGADTLVTGDLKYHEAQLALEQGLNIIDAGHQTTEIPVMSNLQVKLQKLLKEEQRAVVVNVAKEKIIIRYL